MSFLLARLILLRIASTTLAYSILWPRRCSESTTMIAPRNTASFLSLLLFVATAAAQNTANFDQFTYGSTDTSDPDNRIYGPSDWGRVRCPNLDICVSSQVPYVTVLASRSRESHIVL